MSRKTPRVEKGRFDETLKKLLETPRVKISEITRKKSRLKAEASNRMGSKADA